MLAVFCKPRELSGSPLSPVGAKRRLLEHNTLTPEEEEYVAGVLDNLYSRLPKRSHAYVSEHRFGAGASGVAYVEALSPPRALLGDAEGDTTLFFSGALENNPSDLEDAAYLLAEYKRAWDSPAAGLGGVMPSLEGLAQLRGAFAFIAYDRLHGRIVAARDSGGGEPLWWGTAMLSEGLLFASSRSLIEGECADAAPFPPGAVFVSEDFSTEGQLLPLCLEGSAAEAAEAALQQEALCRVESASQLRRVESTGEVEAK